MNDGLHSFLEKLSGTCPAKEKENVEEVIRSIERCPLQLNFDDAKDLIGVDSYIEKKLEDFFSSKPAYIPKEGSIPRKIMKALFDSNCTVQSNSGLTKSDLMSLDDMIHLKLGSDLKIAYHHIKSSLVGFVH